MIMVKPSYRCVTGLTVLFLICWSYSAFCKKRPVCWSISLRLTIPFFRPISQRLRISFLELPFLLTALQVWWSHFWAAAQKGLMTYAHTYGEFSPSSFPSHHLLLWRREGGENSSYEWKHRLSTLLGLLPCFPCLCSHKLIWQGTGSADHLTLLRLLFSYHLRTQLIVFRFVTWFFAYNEKKILNKLNICTKYFQFFSPTPKSYINNF